MERVQLRLEQWAPQFPHKAHPGTCRKRISVSPPAGQAERDVGRGGEDGAVVDDEAGARRYRGQRSDSGVGGIKKEQTIIICDPFSDGIFSGTAVKKGSGAVGSGRAGGHLPGPGRVMGSPVQGRGAVPQPGVKGDHAVIGLGHTEGPAPGV